MDCCCSIAFFFIRKIRYENEVTISSDQYYSIPYLTEKFIKGFCGHKEIQKVYINTWNGSGLLWMKETDGTNHTTEKLISINQCKNLKRMKLNTVHVTCINGEELLLEVVINRKSNNTVVSVNYLDTEHYYKLIMKGNLTILI